MENRNGEKLALLCALLLLFTAGCQSRRAAAVGQGDVDSVQDSVPQVTGIKADADYQKALSRFLEDGEDYDYVSGSIDFSLPDDLSFLHPAEDTTTSASAYYLTGVSDPSQELLLNGEPLEKRGAQGSFALMVPLEEGENAFIIQQGDTVKSVTLTRKSAQHATTDTLSKMEPQSDIAARSGEIFTLQCVAPSGSSVSARVNGERVQLKQNSATELENIPATFSAQFEAPQAAGTVDLGAVEYTLNHQGKESTFSSEGKLYAIGKNDSLVVQIKNVSSSVFTEPSVNSGILTTGKAGAVDLVTEFGGDAASGTMYHLRMGGWIQAAAATIVTTPVETDNHVSDTKFSVQEDAETFVFSGTANPLFLAKQDEDALKITLFHTYGIKETDITKSKLFSAMEIDEQEEATTLTLHLKGIDSDSGGDFWKLWGYLITYQDGKTILTCSKQPSLQQGKQPLTGVTIAVDAGHGGTDTGTLGLPYDTFPMEKDVTAATALALQKKLSLLGADVIMVREADENPSMNERMQRAVEARADFYISLHVNSAGYTESAVAANGVEVYYFEPIARALAQDISARISEDTGRYDRGAKESFYRVTMNSAFPSVLVEMGFITNASDFDSLCSKDGVYRTVTAISDSLLEMLSDAPVSEVLDSAVTDTIEPGQSEELA